MDQKKVNVLATEYADQVGKKKPVIVSHGMMMGLKEGQQKMSKSDPMSAIFMEDEEEVVNNKIKKAFCPEKIIEENPVIDYVSKIVFKFNDSFLITRTEENGGDVTYNSFDDLVADYTAGNLWAGDVKTSLAREINKLLQPVRDHFSKDPDARALLATVRQLNEAEAI